MVIFLCCVYLAATVTGFVVPFVLRWRDRRFDEERVRTTLSEIGRRPRVLGMLSGGPERMVDAVVTELVECGVVQANDGILTADLPEQLDPIETGVADAVSESGAKGLREVRQRLGTAVPLFAEVFAVLARHRLLIGRRQRAWIPLLFTLGVFVPIVAATLGMFGVAVAAEGGAAGVFSVIFVVGWLPITMGVNYLMSHRDGYSGGDPQTPLGVACVARALAELPPNATQADRVALGGFRSATDPVLRKAIQARTPDSTWRVPRPRDAKGIDVVAAILVEPVDVDVDRGP
jgi:uncharacterized protein (TIGR04222 family)